MLGGNQNLRLGSVFVARHHFPQFARSAHDELCELDPGGTIRQPEVNAPGLPNNGVSGQAARALSNV